MNHPRISIKCLQVFTVSATSAVCSANPNHLPVFKINHSHALSTYFCKNTYKTLSLERRTKLQRTYRSFVTRLPQLKITNSSGERFKGFEVLQFSMSATTSQLLSSGEFRKQRYETIPVKSASAIFSFYINNSKMPNFELLLSSRK